MKLSVVSGFAFLLSAGLLLTQFASGYFIRLAPFGILSPYVELLAVLTLMLLAIGSFIYLGFGKRPLLQRLGFVAGTMAALALPLATQLRPIGFELRVNQYSQSEWLRLADDARTLLRASSDDGQLPKWPEVDWNRKHARKLAETYPVLRLGDFTPKIFVTEEVVSIYWGSGLIGTLAVEVSSGPSSQPITSNGFYQRKKVSEHVTLVW